LSHFTKEIKTDQGYLNFYINKMVSADGLRYHISVVDKSHKANIFQMKEEGGRWRLVNPSNCPQWVLNIENDLSDFILQIDQ
jgi:hypothetical protein